MNKIINLLFCVITSATQAQKPPELFPVNDRKLGAIGYYLENGTNVVKPQFCSASYLINDKFYRVSQSEHTVNEDGEKTNDHVPDTEIFAILDTEGKFMIGFEHKYTNIFDFNEDFFVEKNELWGMVTPKNEIIIPLAYQYLSDAGNTFINAKSNDKYGIIDKNNKIIIPFEYDDIGSFYTIRPNHRPQTIIKLGNKTGIIDLDNKFIVTPQDIDIQSMTPNLLVTKVNNQYGITDYKLKTIVPNIYEYSQLDDDKIIFTKDGYTYTFDQKGKMIRKSKNVIQEKLTK